MRRWVFAWVVVLAGGAVADPPKLRPKPPRPDSKALVQTLEAISLDRQGSLHFAKAKYHDAIDAARTTPDPWFNLAQLALRLEMPEAEMWFRYYLEHAGNAPDRAEIEKLVKQLQTAAPIVTLGGRVRDVDDEADAIVLLDGVLLGASPATTTTTVGNHIAERITASTYRRTPFHVREGEREYVDLWVDKKSDAGGNVVISGPNLDDRKWRDGDTVLATHARFKLPRGKHAFAIAMDHRAKVKTCTPVAFEVKSESEITYVRVVTPPKPTGDCFTVEKVDVQRLRVSP